MYTEEGGSLARCEKRGGMQASLNEGRGEFLNVDLFIYRNCQRNCVLGVQRGEGRLGWLTM